MKPEDIIQEFNKLILFSIRTMRKKKSGKEFFTKHRLDYADFNVRIVFASLWLHHVTDPRKVISCAKSELLDQSIIQLLSLLCAYTV